MLIQEVEDEPSSGAKILEQLESCQGLELADKIDVLNNLHSSLKDASQDSLGDKEDVYEAIGLLSELIKPGPRLFADEHPQRIRDEQSKEQWRMLTEVILECIDLAAKSQPEFIELDHAASIALIAYTDSSEAWCSEAAQRKALRILKDHGPQASESKFIINDLLQDFIRSLFRDSKPDTVTAEGRKKTVPDVVEKKFSPSGLYDPVKRPWKYRDIHAATVLRWAVEKSDSQVIADSWHLFIPPLLTLVDDISAHYKLRGMALATSLLPKLPQRILEQTGLGDVIEEAIMPITTYLPSLTPTDESVLLLRAAYEALFTLLHARFSGKATDPKRAKMLDKMLRKGVIYAYHHCPENLTIVFPLLDVMGDVIKKMGVQAIKHLKDVLPILFTILMDPFAPASPPTLLQATKTTQIVIETCWITLVADRHRHDFLKALTVAWLNLREELPKRSGDNTKELEKAKRELIKTAQGYKACAASFTKESQDLKDEIAQMIAVQPQLEALFSQ